MTQVNAEVAVIFRKLSRFVSIDVELLERHFQVRKLRWRHLTSAPALAELALSVDVVYSWFAGPYAALATYYGRMFGTKTVTMLGGYDCARIEEIGYGAFLNPLLASFVKIAVDRSDAVAAVDGSLVSELKDLTRVNREISVIPTGYDSTVFRPNESKEPLVLTVGEVDRAAALRKGLYTFADVARRVPGLSFVVAGRITDQATASDLLTRSGGRLQLTGRLDLAELVKLYARSKVYCQLSRHEGLPNALCEAMLSECVPVGTKHGGIPTAIGGTGFYCDFGDVDGTTAAIHQALAADGRPARQRIADLFPIAAREESLVRLLNSLL